MRTNRLRFRLAFSNCPEPLDDVWNTITSCLRAAKCLPNRFEVSQIAGHPEAIRSEKRLKLTHEEIGRLIRERDLSGFHVCTGYSERSIGFELMHMEKSGGHSVLSCRIEKLTKTLENWMPLIESIMVQWPCIGAWQWPTLYGTWQNTKSPSVYERHFGQIPSETKRSIVKSVDNIGPDREILDSTLNPGRTKELLFGAFFFASAEMWLGPHFWQHAKCTREEVLEADFFLEKRDTPNFLYLKCWPTPFSRPDGEQGLLQQKLWRLFFHEDCEWPPGSGGISMEPKYGPPELMP